MTLLEEKKMVLKGCLCTGTLAALERNGNGNLGFFTILTIHLDF